MAFHVACPITCRRICFCSLGFSRSLQSVKAKDEFVDQIVKLEAFLQDPWGIRVSDKDRTVQVLVPKITPPPPQPQLSIQQTQIQLQLQPGIDEGGGGTAGGDGVEEISAAAAAASAQTKRVALQKKAAAAMVAAEDFARRFEAGDLPDAPRSRNGEEQGQSNVNVMCRMCFFGENEGSDKAKKMLSCKSCGKKYHRSCLKSWAQNRDLFHWSSWTCPSCRTCEVCRRTGDPNKFMFCKRCDAASHCYCQQPPHKNVSSGPYLCPKHTRCHSCGSNVPGNGLSVRWFLGYTCCDACGRLFVKGNYCPVCLKVYRDSESTPMVCCDVCQRWVHCQCDGISDEKYLQFQVDGNLQYKCATCRGECYQVKDLEDAVRELWRRRDITDRDLIASLRAAAGLPSQEDIFSISPYSDDEDCWPTRNEHGRSFKFSLKGLVDKSPKKAKDQGKKSSIKKNVRKKEYEVPINSAIDPHQSFEEEGDIKYSHSLGDDKNDDGQSSRNELSFISSSQVAGVLNNTEEGLCFTNRPGTLKHKLVNDVMVKNEDRRPRVVRIKSSQSHGLDSEEETATPVNKSKNVKGKKLVINFGPRKINAASSPRSDTSSCHRDQDTVTPNGSEDISQRRVGDNLDRHGSTDKSRDSKGDDVYTSGQSKDVKVAGREGNLIKLGKVRSDAPDLNTDSRKRNAADGNGAFSLEHPRILFGRRRNEGKTDPAGPDVVPEFRGERTSVREQLERRSDVHNAANSKSNLAPFSNYTPKESKPLLKFKFKKPSIGNQNSVNSEEEKSSIKGQRSKRKRPSPLVDKASFIDDEATNSHQDILMDEIMDAKILKKLGRDAIGKRVEVHQPSDNSWHKGEVTNVAEGTSKLYVTLDDGKIKSLELGKQGVRFVPQKQKRSRT